MVTFEIGIAAQGYQAEDDVWASAIYIQYKTVTADGWMDRQTVTQQ